MTVVKGRDRRARVAARSGVGSMFVVLLVALLMVSCGRPPIGSKGEITPSPVPPGPATGTLTMWAMGTEGLVLGKIAKDFEAQNPGLNIVITPIPWGSAHDKMATAVAAASTPDMAQMGTTWVPEFARANGLDPTPPNLVNPKDFFEGAWNTGLVLGTSFGIPWYVETRLIFYRTDLAAKYGAKVPTNWAEFRTFAETFKKAGIKVPIQLQSSGKGNIETWLPFLWSAGGEILNADQTEYTLNSPQAVKALTYTSSFFHDGLSPLAVGGKTIQQSFVDGETASFLSGPWDIQQVIDQSGKEFYDSKVGVFEMPRDVAPGGFMGGSDLCVFKTAKNRDAAWKFAQYLSTPAVQQKFYDLSKDLPALPAAWKYPPIAGDQKLSVFGKQMLTAKSAPAIPTWEQIRSILDAANEKVNRGVATPQEGVDQMQTNATFVGTGLS